MEHLGLGHDGGASAFVSMGKMSNNVIVRAADPAHQQLMQQQLHPGLVQQVQAAHQNGLVSYANGGVLTAAADPLAVANGGLVDASKTPRILIIQQNQQQTAGAAAAPAAHYQHPALVAASAAAAGGNTPKNMSKKRKGDEDGRGQKRPRHKGPPPPPATGANVKAALPSTTTMATASTESEQRAIRNSYVTDDGRHVCGECGNTLATSWGLDAHIKSVHGKKAFQCNFCDKSFGRKDHLVNHTKSMHTNLKECNQCGFQCSGKEGLSKHIADNHPVMNSLYHQCSECGKNFPSESACKIHIQQEHTTVTCQACGHLCVGTEGLKKHVSEKHQSAGVAVASAAAQVQQAHQASLAASVAAATAAANSKRAAGQSNLKVEVVFKCEFCSGTFSQQSSLNQHIRSFHMELQCVVCGSALVGSESMIAHIQESHQPSKMMANPGGLLFHCEVCETSFAKSSAYDEHFLNDHVFCKVGNELVKPDLTPIPQGGTTLANTTSNGGADTPISSSKLQQHQAAAAGANLNIVYQCEHCDGMFTDANSLAKHIDTAHPEAFRIAAAAAAAAAAATTASSS